ncbi:hypothetical protein SCOCK_200078 [Actinacidiphila cocklensis]|uniref:Uncharacterized protein n=1 Tax=Actinacidiphila cocklensis TaxID=887465 RepID=A0A9W4GQN4_9ACTN|nr:hypothetical protein SCOCK_200078 [Actinacidiphila cocklensis]
MASGAARPRAAALPGRRAERHPGPRSAGPGARRSAHAAARLLPPRLLLAAGPAADLAALQQPGLQQSRLRQPGLRRPRPRAGLTPRLLPGDPGAPVGRPRSRPALDVV